MTFASSKKQPALAKKIPTISILQHLTKNAAPAEMVAAHPRLPIPWQARLITGADHKFLVEQALQQRGLDYYAEKYKTENQAIAAINYKFPAPVWVIPVGFSDVKGLPRFAAYPVHEKGATIASIARQLNADLSALKYYNGIKDTEMTLTKNWLIVPQDTLPAVEPTREAAVSEKRRLDTPIGGAQKFVIHRVREDENLLQYAAFYKTTLEAILTVTIEPPLWAGTVAVIPVGTTEIQHLPRFEARQAQTATSAAAFARELLLDANKFLHFNDLTPDEPIAAGEWVLIPRSRSSVLWRSSQQHPNHL